MQEIITFTQDELVQMLEGGEVETVAYPWITFKMEEQQQEVKTEKFDMDTFMRKLEEKDECS